MTIPQAATTIPEAADEGCEGADRGFRCPPDLHRRDGSVVSYAAGTYQTQVFKPRLEFTRDSSFRSGGESPAYVSLIGQECGALGAASVCDSLFIMSAPSADGIEVCSFTDPLDCGIDITVSESVVIGQNSQLFDVTVQESPSDRANCTVDLPVAIRVVLEEGGRAHIHEIDLGDVTPHLVIISGAANDFEQFLSEEVQPVLDAARFLDD